MHDLTSEQRYALLAQHANEHAMLVLDSQGVILEWSRGAEKLLGWTAEEAIGQSVAMIFTPEDRQAGAASAELHTALALGRSSDVRWHWRKDGSTVFCDGTVSKIFGADGTTLLGFGKIMREAYAFRKEAPGARHSAQSEQRSFLAAVLESVENGIIACDPQGRLTFFNDAARAIHGLDEKPLSFESWTEHYHLYRPDGETPLAVQEIPLYRALQGERVEDAQIVVKTPAGQRRQLQVTGRPLEDGAGQVLGAVISMNDVSALHEASTARGEAMREQGMRIAAERSEARLSKAEEELRLATEAAGLGVWTWDAGRDTGSWENARMYEIFNLAPGAEVPNGARLVADYLHPDDAEAFGRATALALRHGRGFEFTGRFRRPPEDSIRWLELKGALQPRRGESIIIGTAADITERKRTEEALDEARIRLEATLAAGEVASWIWDIRSDRLVADRNLARLFGVPEELSSGAPLSRYVDAIHPDDVAEVERQIALAIDTRAPYRATYRVAGADGRYRWINARGRIDYDGQGQAAILAGVTLDITQQRDTERQLRATEERYRTLIASMDEAFGIVQVLVDEVGRPVDYRFEEVNAAMEKQSGLVNAAGRTIREMVPDIEPHWIEIYGRVALTRQPARFVEHSAAMGYWWDVYATPMGAPEERRIGILFTDVTARKQAEENLRQLAADLSEANRRKTEFLATLAHELRNPLAPMRTGLDLLRLSANGAPGGARVHDMMDRQLRQMVHLIDDLMDVSRINSGKIVLKKEPVALEDAVTNAVETALPAIEAARHRLEVRLPPRALAVLADPTRLAQILGNLLTNAVKYTPSGGRITLSAWREEDTLAIAVADTGIGIPLEEQGRVFEMFSQVSRNMGRAQGGLGIGLSLVRSLVEMHGGGIGVQSPGPGRGSTFTVRLPLIQGDSPAAAAPGDAAPDPRTGLRILVADDNVDAAEMLGSLLEAGGRAVEPAHDGVAALRRIVAGRPDLAILDIGMPGLNGYEVAEKIRATPGMDGVMLVALTGWGGELDRTRSRQAGFDAHLTKPAGLAELDRLLAQATARKAGLDPQA